MLEDAFGQSIKTVIEENGEGTDEMVDDTTETDADEPVYDGEEYEDDDE